MLINRSGHPGLIFKNIANIIQKIIHLIIGFSLLLIILYSYTNNVFSFTL